MHRCRPAGVGVKQGAVYARTDVYVCMHRCVCMHTKVCTCARTGSSVCMYARPDVFQSVELTRKHIACTNRCKCVAVDVLLVSCIRE